MRYLYIMQALILIPRSDNGAPTLAQTRKAKGEEALYVSSYLCRLK